MKRSASARVHHFVNPSIRLHVRHDLHLARKAWHMTMGLLIAGIYGSGMAAPTAVIILSSVLGFAIVVEMTRLHLPSFNETVLKFWGPIMRNHEAHKMSTVPHYLLATTLAIAIFPRPVAVLSVLYLACGDPIASLFGILYGNLSIRFKNGKSLIGSIAGVLACALVSLIFLTSVGLPTNQVLLLSAIGGLAGGCAELLPFDVDDNFTIPVVSGFVVWLAWIALGVNS